MPSISKYALVFKNRMLEFQQDLDAADIFCTAQKNNDLLEDETKLFKYLNPNKHRSLNRRSVNIHNKKIVINHLRSTIYNSFIKDIFEELSHYLKKLLYEAALISKEKEKANRLMGEHKITLTAAQIIQYSSLDDLIVRIAEDIVQALENERSTKSLIKKICTKINLTVDDIIIEEALPYLELRHKLVHTDGKVDDAFKTKYTMFTYSQDNYVKLNYEAIKKAKSKITFLVNTIDAAAIAKGILTPNNAT